MAGQRRRSQPEQAERLQERAEQLAQAATWLRDVLEANAEAEERLEAVRLELRAAVAALHQAGASFDEIGTMIGVSRQRAQQLAQEYAEQSKRLTPKGLESHIIDLARTYAVSPESVRDIVKPLPDYPRKKQ